MKITKVELLPVTLKVDPTKDVISGIPCVLVKIHTDAGLVGIGDTGNVSSWYRGETQDSIMAIIAEVLAPLALIGQDPTRIEQIVTAMDYMARDNYQAKMLIDMALYDLKGKIFNMPVHQLLGGACTDKIAIGWVCSGRDPVKLGESAAKAKAAGYKTIKVKIGQAGVSLQDEVRRLTAVRDAVGDDVTINLDANGSWTFQQAVEGIAALAPFKPGYLEQPLHHHDVDGMVRLRRRINSIPIYADEAAQELVDLVDLSRREAVDGLFLKLCKAGGLLKSQRWVTVAQALGLPVITGCMSGSGIEAAAYLHFLSASPATAFGSHDCGPSRALSVFSTDEPHALPDIVDPVPVYRDGFGYVPQGAGLGVTLNDDLVASQITPGKSVVTISDRAQARHDGYRAK